MRAIGGKINLAGHRRPSTHQSAPHMINNLAQAAGQKVTLVVEAGVIGEGAGGSDWNRFNVA